MHLNPDETQGDWCGLVDLWAISVLINLMRRNVSIKEGHPKHKSAFLIFLSSLDLISAEHNQEKK